jgi:hypothetical protein
MNEELLRTMVRESIARHLGTRAVEADVVRPLTFAADASHYRYTLPTSEGPCLIEPGVACTHCGYCESHGY